VQGDRVLKIDETGKPIAAVDSKSK
jgi:hypothetical protein